MARRGMRCEKSFFFETVSNSTLKIIDMGAVFEMLLGWSDSDRVQRVRNSRFLKCFSTGGGCSRSFLRETH